MRCICCVDSSVLAAGALYGAAAAADIFLRVRASRVASVIILPLQSRRARALRPFARVVVVPSTVALRALGLSPRSPPRAAPPRARVRRARRPPPSPSRARTSPCVLAVGPSRRSASVDLVTETDARAVARARAASARENRTRARRSSRGVHRSRARDSIATGRGSRSSREPRIVDRRVDRRSIVARASSRSAVVIRNGDRASRARAPRVTHRRRAIARGRRTNARASASSDGVDARVRVAMDGATKREFEW